MRGKRILAYLLSAALLAGMLPGAALAAEVVGTCENHMEHTTECGYEEGGSCSHVCELCAPMDSGHPAGTSAPNVTTPENREAGVEGSGPYDAPAGDYSFAPDTQVLTVMSNAGTTAWRNDPDISADSVTSVVLESGVTEIGREAFKDCTKLETVDFTAVDDSLTAIKDQAFRGCTNLSLTSLPARVTTIGSYAFSECYDLALTSLPSSVTSIENWAFGNCKKLALTSLPENLTTINSYTFYACTDLALDALPDRLTTINSAAFQDCTGLALTTMPSNLRSIGSGAFLGCTGISSLTFPHTSAPTLGQHAFKDISDLVIFVPCGATGYDGANWSTQKVVYGAALSKLEVSASTLAPAFFPGTNTYSVYVANNVDSIIVTPTAHESETITVNGSAVTSGSSSSAIQLPTGATTTIAVVAKNSGTDSRTYTIQVTRMAAGAVPATGVKLDQTTLTLYTNKSPGTATLTAMVEPENATIKDVTWASSDTGIATVDSSGRVAAVSPGTATITAITLDGGKSAACTVTVEESSVPVTGVVLDRTALTLYTNKSPSTATLTATVQPGDATNKTVNWTSSAPGVATVDSSGNVTAVTPGTAIITVTTQDGGKTAACSVAVEKGSSGGGGGGGGSSDSGPSYLRRTLTDKPTGVTVAGERLHEYAALTVKTGALHKTGDAGCDLLRSAQKLGRVLSLYDISLSRGFRGSVTVSLPVEGRDGQTLTVAHCIGGQLTLSSVKVEKGMAAVTVDDLSPFALLDGVYTMENLTAPVLSNPFTDVKESDWFYNAVMFAYRNGLMSGTSAATFDPQGLVTRAQPPVVLYRLEGSPTVTAQIPFADIRPGQWYADGVTWAAGTGLVSGYSASAYGPGDPITREQLAAILYRYAQYKQWDASQRDGLTAYTDAGDVSVWAREAMEWAVGAGLLKGSDGRLTPKDGATRAEFAQMLQRFLNRYQPAAPVALASGTSKPRRHRVQKGDTLSALARRFHCTVADLVAANAIIKNPDFILPGWELDIP